MDSRNVYMSSGFTTNNKHIKDILLLLFACSCMNKNRLNALNVEQKKNAIQFSICFAAHVFRFSQQQKQKKGEPFLKQVCYIMEICASMFYINFSIFFVVFFCYCIILTYDTMKIKKCNVPNTFFNTPT